MISIGVAWLLFFFFLKDYFDSDMIKGLNCACLEVGTKLLSVNPDGNWFNTSGSHGVKVSGIRCQKFRTHRRMDTIWLLFRSERLQVF